MISRIPRIRSCPSRVHHGAQVAGQVVRLGVGPKRDLLIIGVVTRGGEGGRNGGASERATDFGSVACGIVGIGERTQAGRAFLQAILFHFEEPFHMPFSFLKFGKT